MKIYIDTEFNGFGGNLISIALVAEDGQEFYEVLPCQNPVPWVAEHVIPFLEKDAVEMYVLQRSLQSFLWKFEHVHLIADWPDDIRYFCQALITAPGQALSTPPITMSIRRDLNSENSELPHNALYDARALAQGDV
jgi:hypothetical protein